MITAENIKSQVQIRNATEPDVPFIFNSWLKSYRGANAVKSITNPVYFEFQHKTIEGLLKRCQVLVLCNSADSSQVYGYLIFEQVEGIDVLHYAYVKHAFRNMGLCNLLLSTAKISPNGGFYTHETHTSTKLCGKKKLVYNPYLAFNI